MKRKPTCYCHPWVEGVVGGLLVELRRHGGLVARTVEGARVPGADAAGGAASRRSRAARGISSDETDGAVADTRVRGAGRGPDRADQRVGVGGASGSALPDVFGGGRDDGGVAVLMGGLRAGLGAVGLGSAVVDAGLLSVVGGRVELAGGGHGRVVGRVLWRPGLVKRVVMVVLTRGVRRHPQTQREAVGRRRSGCLVMVVTTRRLMVVAPVETTLLKIRVHFFVIAEDLRLYAVNRLL